MHLSRHIEPGQLVVLAVAVMVSAAVGVSILNAGPDREIARLLAASGAVVYLALFDRSKRLVAYLRRAIDLDPETSEPRWLLFSFLLDAPPVAGGDSDEARKVAEALLEVDRRRGYQALRRYHAKLNDEAEAQRYAELIELLETVL